MSDNHQYHKAPKAYKNGDDSFCYIEVCLSIIAIKYHLMSVI
jgi:hypothetical protein